MKKHILLPLILLLLFTGTCSAAYEITPNEWLRLESHYLNTDQECTSYFSLETFDMIDNDNIFDYWTCTIYPNKNIYAMSNCQLYKNKTMTCLYIEIYDRTTLDLIYTSDFTEEELKPYRIVPDSLEESLYEFAFNNTIQGKFEDILSREYP